MNKAESLVFTGPASDGRPGYAVRKKLATALPRVQVAANAEQRKAGACLPWAGNGLHAASSATRLHIDECKPLDDRERRTCAIRMERLLMLAPTSNVAILGFGARAARFAALLAPRGCALRAWDPALAAADGGAMRASIEAAGVDCMAELSAALRGARLVVLDTVPLTAGLAAQLQQAQQLLDLATAAAADIDAVLVALGVPHGATAAPSMANSAAATPGTPPVRRGELP